MGNIKYIEVKMHDEHRVSLAYYNDLGLCDAKVISYSELHDLITNQEGFYELMFNRTLNETVFNSPTQPNRREKAFKSIF